MPISDIQLRVRELGRIRMGEKGANNAPVRLEKFRLTSPDRTLIEEAAARYGGTVRPWKDQPGQYEVKILAEELPIYVSQHSCLSQNYELWSAGGCIRRCDGRWNEIRDCPCECDPDNRECKPTTRFPVMLYELSGVGVWRLETHGYYGAVELPGAAEILRSAASAGQFVPASLAIEQRTVKRIGHDGKSQTRKFPVPVIRLKVRLENLLRLSVESRPTATAVESGPARLAIEANKSVAEERKRALRDLRASEAWTLAPDDREGTVRAISDVLKRPVTVETFGQVSADELTAVRMILEAGSGDAWDDGSEADAPAPKSNGRKPDPLNCPACGLPHADGACTVDAALPLDVPATAPRSGHGSH